MSDLTDQILTLIADDMEAINYRPGGHGHTLNDGQQVRCTGRMGPNPRLEEDAAFDPPAEVLIQHVLGRFVVDPEAKARGVLVIAVGNESHDGEFVLADGATFDPDNPVCSECGQPFTLN